MTDDKKAEKIGKYLLVSSGTINDIVEQQLLNSFTDSESEKRIGDTLVEKGILSQSDLEEGIRRQRIARLAACPVFESLEPVELAAISKCFKEVSVPAGEIFIMQGQKDPALFIIASGQVEVFKLDNTGHEIPIAEVGAGEPIGEMGYFSGGIRTACVRTLELTHLLRVEYSDLTSYFEKVPRVALAFADVVKQRKREA